MSLASDHAVETPAGSSVEQTEIAGRSLTQIAWGRLRRDKVAMVSLGVVLLVILIAVFAPLITKLVGVDPLLVQLQGDRRLGRPAQGPVGRHQPGPPAGRRARHRA